MNKQKKSVTFADQWYTVKPRAKNNYNNKQYKLGRRNSKANNLSEDDKTMCDIFSNNVYWKLAEDENSDNESE